MAAKTGSKRPSTFYQLVLSGPEDLTLGFLSGLVIGSGHEAVLIHCPDEDIAGPSFGDRVLKALHVHPQETCVVVDSATRSLVKRKAKLMFAETGIQLEEDHKVRAARFEFRYKAYAKRYGDEIDALLKTLPKGIRLLNREHEESTHPEAKGPEAYAPAHHYELKGCGEAAGRIDLILQAHRTMDTHPLVEVEEIELDLI